MKIETVGTVGISKVSRMIKDIVAEALVKGNLPEDLKFNVKDLSATIVFKVDGKDQIIEVEHDGIKEPFIVKVPVDAKGNIIKTVDNSEKSFMDDYSRSVVKGEKMKYGSEEIVSEYDDKELTLINTITHEDRVQREYTHKTTGTKIFRYFVKGKLIGEVTGKDPVVE